MKIKARLNLIFLIFYIKNIKFNKKIHKKINPYSPNKNTGQKKCKKISKKQ